MDGVNDIAHTGDVAQGVSITHPSQEVQGVEYVPISHIVYQL